MYRSFIKGIEEYKSKTKASLFNFQLIHHHSSAGVARADLLKEIVMRLLICGYYEHIEILLSLNGKQNSYFNSSISIAYMDEINKEMSFNYKYSTKEMVGMLNAGNNNPSSMRPLLRKSLSFTGDRISSEDKQMSYLYKKHIDHSLMAYKLFAASLHNPLNPFYRKVEEKAKLLNHLNLVNDRNSKDAKIDFMESDFISLIDLSQDHVYKGNEKIKIYGQPLCFKENKIALVSLVDDKFQMNKNVINNNGLLEIYAFTGLTGATKNNPNQNQKSILGYVSYHRKNKDLTIAFRGSRSGDAVSAMMNALLFSAGNGDWITDMDTFNTAWDPSAPNFLSAYKKVFTSIKGINISQGFTQSFASTMENIECIIEFLKSEHKTINSITTTGHSLGGALAQVCYLCLKFGALSKKELIGNCQIYSFPFSAPPVLTKPSIKRLGLSNENEVIHSYLDSDLVHLTNLDKSLKSSLLKMCVKVKGLLSFLQSHDGELAHFGVNLFKFSTDVYKEKINFPASHKYENFYKIVSLDNYLRIGTIDKLSDIRNNKKLNYIECLFYIVNKMDFDIIIEVIQFIGLQRKIDISNILKQINNANNHYKMIDRDNHMSYTKLSQVDYHIKIIISLMKQKNIKQYILTLQIYREAIAGVL